MSERLRTCPLGHTCDECLWQVEVQKQSPEGEVALFKTCAVAEMVSAQALNIMQTSSVGAAVESLRNLVAGSRVSQPTQPQLPKD